MGENFMIGEKDLATIERAYSLGTHSAGKSGQCPYNINDSRYRLWMRSYLRGRASVLRLPETAREKYGEIYPELFEDIK